MFSLFTFSENVFFIKLPYAFLNLENTNSFFHFLKNSPKTLSNMSLQKSNPTMIYIYIYSNFRGPKVLCKTSLRWTSFSKYTFRQLFLVSASSSLLKQLPLQQQQGYPHVLWLFIWSLLQRSFSHGASLRGGQKAQIYGNNIDGKLVYAATWQALEFLYIRVNDDIQFGDTHGGPPSERGWTLDGRRSGYLSRKLWRSE